MKRGIEQALKNDKVVDITTIGRKSGQPRRIEIWLHYHRDGIAYLTGSPGTRDWYANLLANPEFTVHVKRGAEADLPAEATPITDADERGEIFSELFGESGARLEERIAGAPLVRVKLGD